MEPIKSTMSRFKAVCRKNGPFNPQAEIPFLSALAEHYLQQARDEPHNWTHYLRAHTLFNSCCCRADGKKDWQWKKKIYDVEKLFYSGKHPLTELEHKSLSVRHKTALNGIRERMRCELEPIKDCIKLMNPDKLISKKNVGAEKKFSELVQIGTESCNDRMKSFAATIIEDSISLSGRPPCAFAVVALGSMSRGEMTPFSDFEYMFVVEKSEELKTYFETLAVTSYFLIGNLQETNLKCMSIKEFTELTQDGKTEKWFEDKSMSGFKIDGIGCKAGNIPTGNEDHSKYFIKTPHELFLDFNYSYQNPSTSATDIVGDLSDMLQSTTLVFSFETGHKLYDQFLSKINKVERSKHRVEKTYEMFLRDTENFEFLPRNISTSNTRCLNVKEQLYRYPTIIFEDLKILGALKTTNVWETLEKIIQENQPSEESRHALTFLLSVALFLRLDVYLFYNTQNGVITAAQKYSGLNLYCFPRNLFISFCSFVFPLRKHPFATFERTIRRSLMPWRPISINASRYPEPEFRPLLAKPDLTESGCDSSTKFEKSRQLLNDFARDDEIVASQSGAFNGVRIGRDTALSKAYAHAYCLEWSECLNHLQATYMNGDKELDIFDLPTKSHQMRYADVLGLASVAAFQCGYFDISLRYIQMVIDYFEMDDLVMRFYSPVYTWYLEFVRRDLQIASASFHSGKGGALLCLGRYDEALASLAKAIELEKAARGAEGISDNLALSHYYVGDCCKYLGKLGDALVHYRKSLMMLEYHYGVDAINFDIALQHLNLGNCFQMSHKPLQGLAHFQKAKKLFLALYGTNYVEANIASSVFGVGLCSFQLGKNINAIAVLSQALVMLCKLEDHDKVHLVYEILVEAYVQTGNLDTAFDTSIKAVYHADQFLQSHSDGYHSYARFLTTFCACLLAPRVARIWSEFTTAVLDIEKSQL